MSKARLVITAVTAEKRPVSEVARSYGVARSWIYAPAGLEQAKAHCHQCPLRTACLAGALARAEPYGVWGGEIFHQGAIRARKRPRGRPPRTRPDGGKGPRA
jgi:hypothetical protein